jgi:sporulation protein YlmC with PRC-barrel domain
MLSSLKRMRRYQVAATDARVGSLEDFYFDTENWDVRYLVVAKGMLLWRRSYVIPALAVASVEPHERRLRLRLSKEQVARCSRTAVGQALSRRARRDRTRTVSRVANKPRLRSAKQLIGHRVQAIDGTIGRVADVLVDTEPRKVPRLVLASGKWLPGRKVTVSTEQVRGIIGANRRVFLDMRRQAVRNGPNHDAEERVW